MANGSLSEAKDLAGITEILHFARNDRITKNNCYVPTASGVFGHNGAGLFHLFRGVFFTDLSE